MEAPKARNELSRPPGNSDIPIANEGDIVRARQEIRALARVIGFGPIDLTLIATAISEIARNIIEFAGTGVIHYETLHDHNRQGIEIVAEDHGPGIANIELAMQNGFSTRKSLGMGLPGTRRLVDDFHIQSSPGRGTKVTMRKWIQNRPAR